jgi:hypothetical protein
MYPDDNYEPSGKVLPRILSSSGTGRGSGSSSDEIEAQLQATVRVWQTLQQQIQRGEDHYVEESGSFNIYKGWDGFIDARLFETMPKRFDHRWFSSSVSHTLSHQVNTKDDIGFLFWTVLKSNEHYFDTNRHATVTTALATGPIAG